MQNNDPFFINPYPEGTPQYEAFEEFSKQVKENSAQTSMRSQAVTLSVQKWMDGFDILDRARFMVLLVGLDPLVAGKTAAAHTVAQLRGEMEVMMRYKHQVYSTDMMEVAIETIMDMDA